MLSEEALIINRMLVVDFQGHMNTSKYAKLSKYSTDTALRDIQELKAREVFVQTPVEAEAQATISQKQ